jgi:hypothetical protein
MCAFYTPAPLRESRPGAFLHESAPEPAWADGAPGPRDALPGDGAAAAPLPIAGARVERLASRACKSVVSRSLAGAADCKPELRKNVPEADS